MNLARFLLCSVAASCCFAQSVPWDTSGNALLSGTYNFREVLWIATAQGSNALVAAKSQYGTITFDGHGGYASSVSVYSSDTNTVQTYTRVNTYAIAASGFGYINRDNQDGDILYGLLSNGVFIGSSTESGLNNLFVAAKQSTTPLTTASFNQPYTMAYVNLSSTNLADIRDATFNIAPNGAGAMGAISVTGYIGGTLTQASQTVSTPTYSFAGGIGTLSFGTSVGTQTLLSGTQTLYASPDGQLVFGGNPRGWDIFIGIRAPTSVPSTVYAGLYYQAGLDVKRTALPAGAAVLDSYFGAFNVIPTTASPSSGNIIGHQRVQVAPDSAYEYTYSDTYTLNSVGSHDDLLGVRNFLTADGSFRIGYGRSDYLGLNVTMKAPTFTGTAPYINPTGVVNAASFTPFTVGISGGELITLFGTGMSAGNAVDATFPTTLGGVQVKINGAFAPLYVVSPGQISAIVPYETVPGVAEIQVIRNGTASNRVTVYANNTSPGVFAVPPTGLGYAAALHPNYTLVSATSPAKIGESIAVYLTGLGAVSPAVPNGSAGAINPFNQAINDISVTLGGRDAKVDYAGLAPLLRGLYQLNVEVPSGTPAGDQYLEISTPDALNSQILMPVTAANTATAAAASANQIARLRTTRQSSPRTRKRFDPAATGSSSPSSDK